MKKSKYLNKNENKLFIVLLLLIGLPVALYVTYNSSTLISFAAPKKCMVIQRVDVNPGKVDTFTNIPAVYISALAYDINNNPIPKGVHYNWGISSNNSIGKLRSNQDLATFMPVNAGYGDIYVIARNACTKQEVIKSIIVTVQGASLN